MQEKSTQNLSNVQAETNTVGRRTFLSAAAGVAVWFTDGPAYYMQHEHFRSKPAGFEFFTHITEAGHIDNLQVW